MSSNAAATGSATAARRSSSGVAGSGGIGTESWRGAICGVAFGVASPLAAHPFDTLKSRMQADVEYARTSAVATLRGLLRDGGVRALYRGLLPPLLGSALYRSIQFAAFGAAYAGLRDERWATAAIPGSGGLQGRVLLAAAAGTTARALIETPLEVWKIRRQLAQPVFGVESGAAGRTTAPARAVASAARELFTGFGLTWARLYLALGSFFVICDTADRHAPQLFSMPVVGPFLKGGVAATLGWWLAWPLETLKSQVQAGGSGGGAALSVVARMRGVLQERGLVGLYRGIGPGTLRSLLGNGAAFTAFSLCQQCFGPG